MVLDKLDVPIVLAPMAGGPSTPELVAAVSDAGGIGFLALGYQAPAAARERIKAVRGLSSRPFGVNVFAAPPGPTERATYEPYVARLAAWANGRGLEIGRPRYGDDELCAKIDLLTRDPVAVVSFTFGCPPASTVPQLQAAGSEVWITVTSPAEAVRASELGADVLVVQGSEAGGHRASFIDRDDLPTYGLLALLQLIGAESDRPLVASGGIATGAAVAAALSAGASAVQVGTAFMLAPEAGTSPTHRAALVSERETSLTRAFTGRLARGIRNEFMAAHDDAAPIAYPEVHYVTAPMRQAARASGDPSLMNLWAGETHVLARKAPASEIVRELAEEAREASRRASERLAQAGI